MLASDSYFDNCFYCENVKKCKADRRHKDEATIGPIPLPNRAEEQAKKKLYHNHVGRHFADKALLILKNNSYKQILTRKTVFCQGISFKN